jgi:MFS family permease
MNTSPTDVTPASADARVSRRRLTIGLCMTVVAIAFEAIAVATAMPIAARALNGLDYYAWAFSLFLIGMLFATVVGGRVSDRTGPAKPLIAGLLIFAAGLVVSGTADRMVQLVGGRLVQGLGSGVINVSIFVCVAKAYAPAERPRMFSYISTAWVLPSFIGPPVSAWLTHHLSWHWVFFAVLPLVALGGGMVAPTLVAMIRAHERGEEVTGSPPALWAAGLVAVAAALIQLAGQQLRLANLVLLVGGVGCLLLGLPRLMPPGFLRSWRGLSAVIGVRGLLPGAFFGGEAFIPLMLVEQRKIALIWAGAMLTVGAVGWTAGSWLQAESRLRWRRDRFITVGCASVAGGLALVALTAWLPGIWFGVVGIGWVFAGLGMGLSVSSTSLAVMTLSTEPEQGRNASSLNLFDALGSGVLVGVAGTLFAALHPGGDLPMTFGTLLLAMAGMAVLAVLVSLRIGPVPNELSETPAT